MTYLKCNAVFCLLNIALQLFCINQLKSMKRRLVVCFLVQKYHCLGCCIHRMNCFACTAADKQFSRKVTVGSELFAFASTVYATLMPVI